MFENNEPVYNYYTHEALGYYYKLYKDGKMSLAEYLRTSTNLLDKTYGKNSMYTQIKSGRIFKQ